LVAFALLTSITHTYLFIARLEWQLMAMKNMANNGSGRMTKARVPLRWRHTDTAEDAQGGWILQTVQALAQSTTKQNVPGCSVLDKKIKRVKFT
jgi:hypothetical protein